MKKKRFVVVKPDGMPPQFRQAINVVKIIRAYPIMSKSGSGEYDRSGVEFDCGRQVEFNFTFDRLMELIG